MTEGRVYEEVERVLWSDVMVRVGNLVANCLTLYKQTKIFHANGEMTIGRSLGPGIIRYSFRIIPVFF